MTNKQEDWSGLGGFGFLEGEDIEDSPDWECDDPQCPCQDDD